MATLSDKDREMVALGASIGAGCRPCTQYHVGAARKSGLRDEQILGAREDASAVRSAGATAVANVGRGALDGETEAESDILPSGREQALTYIGAAAGCNAGGLLAKYLSTGESVGLSGEELREALDLSEVVKGHAADFLRKDAERALKELPPAAATEPFAEPCCGSEVAGVASGAAAKEICG